METWDYSTLKHTFEKKQKFKTKIDNYQKENKITVKCISDRILLYLRYGMDADPGLKSHKNDPEYPLEPVVMDLYYKIRGDPEYTCKNPVGMATAILYIATVMNGINRTQKEVAELFGVSEVSIRNNYLLLKKKLKL